jgi:hypothetical protein
MRDLRDLPEENPHPVVDAEPVRDKLPRFANPDYPDSDDEDMPELLDDVESDDEEDDGPRMEAGRADDVAQDHTPADDDAPRAAAEEPVAPTLRRSTRASAPRRVLVVSGNMSLKKALRLHGDVADAACRAELIQMVRKGVFRVLTPTEVRGRPII